MKLKIIGMFYIQFYQCVTQTPSDQETLTNILFLLQNQHDLEELLFHTVFLGATDSDNCLICYLHRTLVHFCICICYNVFAYVIVKRLFIVCLFCNMTCYASSMSACFCLYLCCFFVMYVHFNQVVAVHVNKLLLLHLSQKPLQKGPQIF